MVRTKRASHRVGASEVDEMDASGRSPSPPARQPQQPPNTPPPPAPVITELGFHCHDARQQYVYDRLHYRPCRCTRGVNWSFFDLMGLKSEFRVYLRDVGLKALSDLEEDTYRNLTIEFLSSLEQVRRTDEDLPRGSLKFRLKDVELSLTPREFARVFRVSDEGHAEITTDFDPHAVWSQLVGRPVLFVKEGSASQVRVPQDRLLRAFLSCLLTFRGTSTHKVSREELFLMWCYKSGRKVNVAEWIMNRMHKTAQQDKGDIMIGGFVTRIAKHFQLEFTDEDRMYQILYVADQHGMGAKILEGSRVIKKLQQPDRRGRMYELVGIEEVHAGPGQTSAQPGQSQAPMEQGQAEMSSQQRPRVGTRRQRAGQDPSMAEMIATLTQTVQTGFADLRGGIQGVDARVGELSARVHRIETRLDAYMPPAPPGDAPGSDPLGPEFDISDVDLYTCD